jgi:hypothetical protein
LLLGDDEAAKAAKDLEKSEDKSHDQAYNAIISNYYTTDPFFGVNSGQSIKFKLEMQGSRYSSTVK